MSKNENEGPSSALSIVGKEVEISGCVFSRTKALKPTRFEVLDWRWSTAVIMNMENYEELHPAFELLLRNSSMKRAQWSKPFAARDYVKDEKGNWVKESTPQKSAS